MQFYVVNGQVPSETQDEGYTAFHLEDWDRDASITWSALKASIEARREPA